METPNSTANFSSKLSSKIWGHRFMAGQRGPEYVLEFLNVLSGTSYRFNESKYKRNKAIQLRQFIFEGSKQGASRESVIVDPTKKENLYRVLGGDYQGDLGKEKAEVIREFFRNLEVPIVNHSGKLADRSWYAKTLYPLHESLLFFEVRVKGTSVGIERNFFARGGELYYLMISYGTKNNLHRRNFIENRFQDLLTKNVSIEKIIKTIKTTLKDEETNDFGYLQADGSDRNKDELPTLPVEEHPLFEDFSAELEQLLTLEVDVYEMFNLLTSLVCFQLLRYMYDRAKNGLNDEPIMFFDCLDGQNSQIQKLSSKTFTRNDLLIKEKFEEFFKEEFSRQMESKEYVQKKLSVWKNDSNEFFTYMGLNRLHGSTKAAINRTLIKCENYEDVMTNLFKAVKVVISDQLKRHQLSIVKVLVRDGGIGNYKTGSKYRYVLSDNLLKNLVFVNVKPGEAMEFSSFLDVLLTRYGIVIGEKQAKESKLYETSSLNISYFQKNELALREKLRSNGLLVEYSDATAMIRNPYEVKEGVLL
ncbi:hypothetical protein [Ectobacillus antri]|uniref:hypothetical protein n=1 Tax=Ectobacillus antri TaxID=2486280 RepID=UPI000F5B1915|nr:hypothetical protein [Ectobacillus antri]